MKITIEGDAREIATLVLAVQGRQTEDIFVEFSEKLQQEIKNRQEAIQRSRESH